MEDNFTPTPEPTPELSPSPTPIPDYFSELQVVSKELNDLNIEMDALRESSQAMQEQLELANGFLEYQAGFGLFGVIVALCYFSYKFFKMFF